MGCVRGVVLAAGASILFVATNASAQTEAQPAAPAAPTAAPTAPPPAPPAAPTAAPTAPPPAPPGGAAQPYPAPYPYPQPYPYPYGYPPPGAQGYAQPYPPPRQLPAEMPYDETKATPPGYHIEERARKGPIIAGAIVGGIPYVIGVNVAAASSFENHSYWLLVPGAGPFLTMATRDDSCDNTNDSSGDGLECLGDVFITMFLVIDGLMQTTGAVLIGIGVGATKKWLVRDPAALHIGPRRIGTGYGLGAEGRF